MNRRKLIEFIEKGYKKAPDRRVAVFFDRICGVVEREDGGADIRLIDSDSIDVSLSCGNYDSVVKWINEADGIVEKETDSHECDLSRDMQGNCMVCNNYNEQSIVDAVSDQLNKLDPEERVKFIEKMTSGYCRHCGMYNGTHFECGCKPWVR